MNRGSHLGPEPRKGLSPWLSGRTIKSVGTNFGAAPLAFQQWHKFKEAFAPEVIEVAYRASEIPVGRILDPFGGSGTTALAAQFLGAQPSTIEVNPYLADVIEAKLFHYDFESLQHDAAAIIARASELAAGTVIIDASRFLPPTFVEPGVNGRWIFSRALFSYLERLRHAIEDVEDEAHRRLFRALLGGCLVGISNARVSGKGRRYRTNWLDRQASSEDAARRFIRSVTAAVTDIAQHLDRPTHSYELHRGSCFDVVASLAPVDLTVFSPPYPNSFDYTDVYNIELWCLGYLDSMESNKRLRTETMSSHVQVRRDFAPPPSGSPTLDATMRQLDLSREALWNKHIPEMVGGYFAEMAALVKDIAGITTTGGEIWMVVGDSRYAGVDVPVAKVVGELAIGLEMEVVSTGAFREMRSSPQQGGHEILEESLVRLRRC